MLKIEPDEGRGRTGVVVRDTRTNGIVGELQWDENETLSWVWLEEQYRRNGIATRMLDLAKQKRPGIHPPGDGSPITVTDDGRAWMRSVFPVLNL